MILGEGLRLALELVLAGACVFASAMGLARFAGGPAPVVPLARLTGWDLLAAALLFLAAQWLLLPTVLGSAGLAGGLALTSASCLLSWLYLGLRSGTLAPRRRLAEDRRVLGFGTVLVCYLLAIPGLLAVWVFNADLLETVTGEPPAQEVAVGVTALAGAELLLVLVFVIGTQPLLEEALFRGFLWRFLAGRPDFGPRRALAFSAVAFALCHEWRVLLPVLYMGAFFGWIYWRSGRLRYAVFAHAFHNALAVLLLVLFSSAAETAP